MSIQKIRNKKIRNKPVFMPVDKLRKIGKMNGSIFSSKYVADDQGNVYIHKITVKSRSINNEICILVVKMNPYQTRNGYMEYVLTDKHGIKKHLQVHRIVATKFIPNPENKPHVNHKDGNRSHNAVGNLEWNTVSENNIHRVMMMKKRMGDNYTFKIDNDIKKEN